MIRRIILKTLVFILVMTGTAFLVNKLNNSDLDKVSRELEEPVLPLVYCLFEGEQVNLMQGHTQVMSTSLMREGIVPLNEDRSVDLLVEDTSSYGATYSYQLRSIGGDSLVEEGNLDSWENNLGYKQFNIKFRMDMSLNQEYVLVFIVTNESGESARYYTRVVNIEEEYASEIVDYVLEFHETTFIKEVDSSRGNIVSNSLEEADVSDDDLSHVDLRSSYYMVSWGGMDPAVMTGIVPTVIELDKEFAVVKLSYLIEDTKSGDRHYYNVQEYYSATYDRDSRKVEILAFDRYVESIFDEGYISKDRNAISMGISDDDQLEYVSADDNRKLAFVKEGELWYYDYGDSKLIRVFSFTQNNFSDIRTLNTNIDVNIANMDEDGNMHFVVYGYMSRGNHEGKNGISMYRFNVEDLKVQELFFVECDEPYDVMRQEIGRFTYFDQQGYFYYLLDGTIYKVDINTGTQETIIYGVSSDKYIVSRNRKIIAYPNEALEEDVTAINVYNFETGEAYLQTGVDSDRFKALGFVDNDLIYGVAKDKDIIISSDGSASLPLYALRIMQPDGKIIKEYTPDGMYIMDAQVQLDKIYLTRANKINNFYEIGEPDYISYKSNTEGGDIYKNYSYSNVELDRLDIVFPSDIYVSSSVEYNITKNKDYGAYWEGKVDTGTSADRFYVFNNTGYAGEYTSAGRAIVAANAEDSGLVVDGNGNTIYRDIAATTYNTVADDIDEYPCSNISDSLMTCAYMCIEYVDSRTEYENIMACDSWEDAFSQYTDGVGINISGISLDVALYFLDRDVPFAACIDDGRYVLVISYNSSHIRYYDPILDEEVRVTRKEFVEALSLQGNTMYTYTSQ